MTNNPQPQDTGAVHQLHHYYMWSQDNLATLIDVSRPKIKKMLAGDIKPNNIQQALLSEVLKRQLTYPAFVENASRHYRLHLLRTSSDE